MMEKHIVKWTRLCESKVYCLSKQHKDNIAWLKTVQSHSAPLALTNILVAHTRIYFIFNDRGCFFNTSHRLVNIFPVLIWGFSCWLYNCIFWVVNSVKTKQTKKGNEAWWGAMHVEALVNSAILVSTTGETTMSIAVTTYNNGGYT